MTTFKMNHEIMAALVKVYNLGDDLVDGYDEEVVAYQVGIKLKDYVSRSCQGEHFVDLIDAIKGLAAELKASYDEEVLAYQVGASIEDTLGKLSF